jgi:hypothetical protein
MTMSEILRELKAYGAIDTTAEEVPADAETVEEEKIPERQGIGPGESEGTAA